jgi:hypothetical protein
MLPLELSPISSIVYVPVGAWRVALHVMVAFALPFLGTFTGCAELLAEMPLGNALTLK